MRTKEQDAARKAYLAAWREKNADRLREYARVFRERRREELRTYQRERARRPESRAKQAAYQKTERGREVKRATKIKTKYGLTLQQYRDMLVLQGDRCKTCGESFVNQKQTHIDHDHVTGKVRGILCAHCNRALGGVRDRVDVLMNLISYLKGAAICDA